MFLRRCERRKDGKVHTYWALVESYRTKKGSRQRLVTYLGELKPSERSGWAELGRHLDRKQRPQPFLFDPPTVEDAADQESVFVNLKGVRLELAIHCRAVFKVQHVWINHMSEAAAQHHTAAYLHAHRPQIP